MNPEVEIFQLRATLARVVDLHLNAPGGWCVACEHRWPCPTLTAIDAGWTPRPADTDAPSARPVAPQTPEQASGVPEVGSGHSEGLETPGDRIRVTMVTYPVPLADGTCSHGRRVRFNLTAGIIRHDSGNPCDGWVLTHAEAAALECRHPCRDCGKPVETDQCFACAQWHWECD